MGLTNPWEPRLTRRDWAWGIALAILLFAAVFGFWLLVFYVAD